MAKIVEDVRSFALEVNPKFLTTLKYKFSKAEYLDVASIAFKFWTEKQHKLFKWNSNIELLLGPQISLWKPLLLMY